MSVLTTAVVYGASQHEQTADSGLSAAPGLVQSSTRSALSFGVDTDTLLVTIRTVLARDGIKSNQSDLGEFLEALVKESCKNARRLASAPTAAPRQARFSGGDVAGRSKVCAMLRNVDW